MLFAFKLGKPRTSRLTVSPLVTLAVSLMLGTLAASLNGQQALATANAVSATIVLPQKALAGETATLAVLDGAGSLLARVRVELSVGNAITTDATGRASFTVSATPGLMTARIAGGDVTKLLTVVSPSDLTQKDRGKAVSTGPQITVYPRVLSLHDRFTIEGSGFTGEPADNRVFLGDRQCVVLASSSIALEVTPSPRTPVGAAELSVHIAGRDTGPAKVSVVQLDFGGPSNPRAGIADKLTIRARGTSEPLALEIRNRSTAVIELSRGNVQRVTTSGGESNAAQVEMRFLAAGDYSLTARIIPQDLGLPDMGTVRETLVAARSLVTGTWASRLDRLIQRIDRVPHNLAEIRAELRGILDEKPEGQFGHLLESAWQVLARE